MAEHYGFLLEDNPSDAAAMPADVIQRCAPSLWNHAKASEMRVRHAV